LGQTQEAFDILDQLAEEKYGVLIYMKVEKEMFHIHDPVRYQRLLKKMKLD
jgi:hypothetical protein